MQLPRHRNLRGETEKQQPAIQREKAENSAPFPPELPARLIRAYSYVGETVLDPFAGSGTTLYASALWKRNGIGVEINPVFCRMAARRLAECRH